MAFSSDSRLLAGASLSQTVWLWDLRVDALLRNGPAPSPRAGLISETLQRFWGLHVEGLYILSETWDWLFPRDGYYVDQEITIPVGSTVRIEDGPAEPEMRTFDIRLLLDPPEPGEDKLDQLLRWLDEQDIWGSPEFETRETRNHQRMHRCSHEQGWTSEAPPAVKSA